MFIKIDYLLDYNIISCIGGVDYEVLTTRTTIDINFEPQRKRRSAEMPYCTNITIIPDDTFESDEFFFVELRTADEDVILFPQNATITISDDETGIIHGLSGV